MADTLAECDSCEGIYVLKFTESPVTKELTPAPRCTYCGCTDYWDAPKGSKPKVGDVDPDVRAQPRPAGRGGPRPAKREPVEAGAE